MPMKGAPGKLAHLFTFHLSRNFLNSHYKWFIPRYDSYKHNIMRADAFRYFIMYHFGGIYTDLDLLCHKNLDDYLKTFLPKSDIILLPSISHAGEYIIYIYIYFILFNILVEFTTDGFVLPV